VQYCSICGSDKLRWATPEGDHLPRHICGSCDTIHYDNPKMVVGCIIENDKGEIMLCRRGIEPRKDYWNLPCGYLENNETVEAGALREVYEETGAEVILEGLHTVYSLPHAQQVYLIFKARLAPNAHWHLTPESTEIVFFGLQDIPWAEIAFSSNTFAIERFRENLQAPRPAPVALGHKTYAN